MSNILGDGILGGQPATPAADSVTSASIVNGAIDEADLDASTNASLDLADTAVQPAALNPIKDSAISIGADLDTTKKWKWDLSSLTSGVIATVKPLFTANKTLNIRPLVDTEGNIIVQNNTSGQIFIGSDATIGGSNSGIQYSDATTANRAQIKLHSYKNAASVAGVSTLTSRSDAVGVNNAISAGQEYSKWTAQAAAATVGSAPISGTWAFIASVINSLTVTSSFRIQLTNLAGTLASAFTLSSEGDGVFTGTVAASNLSGTNTGDQSIFSTVAVSGQSNVVADTTSDTLTLVAGTNVTITTDASTDTITINASTGLSDGDKGDITVGGSGTTLTIDNDAVTYAKIQNVSATDKLLGRSTAGAGDVEEITCTAFARSILDDANEATFKATVNLEIGTDVQAYDANTAKLNVAQEYTKTQNFNATTLTSTSGSIAWDASSNQVVSHTATENTTLANPSNLVDGATYIFHFIQHASSAKTLAFGSAYKWPGGVAPVVSTGASARDIFTFVSDGTNMYGTFAQTFS